MSQRVLMPGGQIAEFPDGMKPGEIETAIRGHFSMPGVAKPPKQADLPQGILANIPGALKETLGLGDRPGAVPLTGNADTKTPLGVVLKPGEGPRMGLGDTLDPLAEHLTSLAVTAAPVAKAGVVGGKLLSAAPKIGAALGRVGAETAIGAARDVAKTGGVGWDTVIDAALSGGTEVLGVGVDKALKSAGAASRGVKFATEAPEKALDYVRNRLKTVRMVIPSIDPAKKITWDEAIGALKGMTGQDYKVARAEIANWMNASDRQALRPRAGQVFKDMTSKYRVPASSFSEIAQAARGPATTGVGALADTAATRRDTEGVPAGFYAWEALKSGGGRLLEHIPGVGKLIQAAGAVAP